MKNGKVIAMEKFYASHYPPKEECIRQVMDSDAVVLILGFKYGSIDKDEEISITEIEYNTAKSIGLPVFVFQKRHLDGTWQHEETEPDKINKLISFKSRLDEERYRRTYITSTDLVIEVLGTIHEYEIENGIIGVKLPAFSSHEDFFKAYLDEKKLFHHTYPLIGRKQYIEILDEFVESEKKIALFYGRGGIGKSKVIFDFGAIFQKKHGDWQIRYLREGVTLIDDNIRQLPSQHCLIIVDDAHRRPDLSYLFSMAQQYPERVKIILTSRPQSLEYLKRLLIQAGYDTREIVILPEITELKRTELEKLGMIILGKKRQHLLEPLLNVAKDSTLVLVIGGRLIAENAIDPKMLERHEEFNDAVFSRFQDVLLGEVDGKIGAEDCRKILSLISAISPIQPHTLNFQETVSKFLGIDKIKLIDAIGILENHGVLFRRGYTLRITPDVLSDHILNRACITLKEESTGYAQKVFYHFGNIYLENLLTNLAELDWRFSKDRKIVNIFDEVWTIIEGYFYETSSFGRLQILKSLEKVAYFQPYKTISLIQYVIKHPSEKNGEWNQYILEKIPLLVKEISYNVEYLSHCCDLLWELGRDDVRQTSQYPEHAIRILQELSKYDINKPLQVNGRIIDAVERWLKTSDSFKHVHSPLDVIEPILAKEGETLILRGNTVYFQPFPVHYENVKPLRERVISILVSTLKSSSKKAILNALNILINSLQPPRGMFGRKITDDERNRWLTEEILILENLENFVNNNNEPILLIQTILGLQSYLKQGHHVIITEKITSMIESIPDFTNLRITKALWKPFFINFTKDDYKEYQKKTSHKILQTIEEFIEIYYDGNKIYNYLNKIISDFMNCDIRAQPEEFLYLLSDSYSEIAIEICERIITDNFCTFSIYINYLLSGIRKHNIGKFLVLINKVMETKKVILYRSVAYGYAWGSWATTITNEELGIVRELLLSEDITVKQRSIEALSKFPKDKREVAIEFALKVDINNELIGNTYCGIFSSGLGISPDELNEDTLIKILNNLLKLNEISSHSYFIDKFLGYCSLRIPEEVLNFFINRLEIAEVEIKKSNREYHPLPYLKLHHGLNGISKSPKYKTFLQRVRNLILRRSSVTSFWVPKLFAEISNNFSSESLDVLYEWIDSEDIEKIEAVTLLLKDASSDFVFLNLHFTSQLLEKIYLLDIITYQKITSRLFSLIFSGGRSGLPGQPKPKDVKILEKANELKDKFPLDSPTHRFFSELVKRAEDKIRHDLLIDETIFDY